MFIKHAHEVFHLLSILAKPADGLVAKVMACTAFVCWYMLFLIPYDNRIRLKGLRSLR